MKTLEEKNRMIAEFMGIVESSIDGQFWTEKSHEGFGIGKLVGLKYHSSWDWLMPVVEKIESVNEGVPQQLLNVSLFSYIEDVYNAVVEFIEWYNENK